MTGQREFTQALLEPALTCPGGLRSSNGSDPQLRFAVYRNNVTVSLIDALADTFAVVRELVGEQFFSAMAKVFAQANPPRSRIMAYYGETFADFIERFEPASSLPYLADVARLEMGRVRAYHAADLPGLPAEVLRTALADEQTIVSLRLVLHPCVHLVQSRFAVFSLWAAHQGALCISQVDPEVAQTALTFRQGLHVQTLAVPAATGEFVGSIARGHTVQAAAAMADASGAGFDLSRSLALLLAHQLITQTQHEDEHHDFQH